jgi:hypothetical protein
MTILRGEDFSAALGGDVDWIEVLWGAPADLKTSWTEAAIFSQHFP